LKRKIENGTDDWFFQKKGNQSRNEDALKGTPFKSLFRKEGIQ